MLPGLRWSSGRCRFPSTSGFSGNPGTAFKKHSCFFERKNILSCLPAPTQNFVLSGPLWTPLSYFQPNQNVINSVQTLCKICEDQRFRNSLEWKANSNTSEISFPRNLTSLPLKREFPKTFFSLTSRASCLVAKACLPCLSPLDQAFTMKCPWFYKQSNLSSLSHRHSKLAFSASSCVYTLRDIQLFCATKAHPPQVLILNSTNSQSFENKISWAS